MTAQRKRFDKDLYDKYDDLARQKTTQYLTSQNFQVEEHPDKYAQDLIAKHINDDYSYYVECEVKLVWDGIEFPYNTVQLPERKSKFFRDLTRFFIWNKGLTHAMTFWSSEIATLEPVEVPNKYVYSGEYFFQVPMSMVEKVSL
jgi:hypothetical protein